MPQARTGGGSSRGRSRTSTETWKTSPLGEDEEEEEEDGDEGDELRRRTTLTRTMPPSLSRNTCFAAPKSGLEGVGELLVDRLVDAAAVFVLAGDEEAAATMTVERRRETAGDEIIAFGSTISDRGKCRCCCVLRGTAHPLTEAPVAEVRMTRKRMEGIKALAPPLAPLKRRKEKEEKK